MIKLQVSVLEDKYTVYLIKGPEEVAQVSKRTGISMASLVEGFGDNPPNVLGRTYFNAKVIVLSLAGTSSQVLGVLRHELGHAVAHAMGLDPNSEVVANEIAHCFVTTGHLVRRVRDLLGVTHAVLETEAEALERRFDAGRLPYNAAGGMSSRLDCTFVENGPEPVPVSEVDLSADARNMGRTDLFTILSNARRIEVVVNRDISITKGPRVVEIRMDSGRRSEVLQTSVDSAGTWFQLRDAIKQFAAERRIPCTLLFN